VLTPVLAAGAIWTASLDEILDDPRLKGASLGVCVTDDRGNPLYTRQADRRLTPASNQKILTCAYALARLGAEFRPVTRVWRRDGFLFVDAPGNPETRLGDLVGLRRTLGVKGGAPVRVRQAYRPGVGPGWEWDDLQYRYAAPIHAFAVDRSAFEVYAEARMALALPSELGIKVRRGTAKGSLRATFDRSRRTVTVSGPLPKERKLVARFSHPDPESVAARALGGAFVATDEPAPVDPPDARFTGPPLAQTLKTCLEDSDNVFAENLLLMAAASEGPLGPDPFGTAAARLAAFMSKEAGVEPDDLAPADGSGLSRHNQLAPRAVCRLLVWLSSRPDWPVFEAALAAPGEGTLVKRLKDRAFVGKTGTLRAVVSLSGRIQCQDGRRLFVSLIFNDTLGSAAASREVQDRFVESLERGTDR
jgi:serine-type D-Ala-D-Ala carboxypeptidase/endopeptidase (penicillin-binding protein 4)